MLETERPLEIEILHKLRHIDAMSRRKYPPSPSNGAIPPEGEKSGFLGFGTGRLLGILKREEHGIPQTKLAASLNIRPQSLSELLARLENDGFVERHKSETDKRQILVKITDTGREHHSRIREKHWDDAKMLFSPLNTEEKRILADLLNKILQAETNTKGSDK